MNALAPPFPANPTIGQWFGNWCWNGTRWVSSASSGTRIVTTVFTASGSYMPSPGLMSLTVECIGGGGASGAVFAFSATQSGGAGGGGSGGYSRASLPASLVAGGVSVTIGAGGVGGPGDGATGGATSFGALCVANGGGGGYGNDLVNDFGAGGAGGAPGVGDVALPGNAGDSGDSFLGSSTGFSATLAGGRGGTMWGGGSSRQVVGPGATDPGYAGAANTGAGGGGGVAHSIATGGSPGSNGGSGLCIVTEYCWGDTGDDCLNPPINVNARVAVTHVPWTGPGPCPPGWSDE